MAIIKYSRSLAMKAARCQQWAPELLENIRMLWTIFDSDKTEAIWCDTEVIEVVLSIESGMVFRKPLGSTTPTLHTIKNASVKCGF